MLVIGMTGGIASGKSTVAQRLRELGAVVLDADQVARDVVDPGTPALQEIREFFGNRVIAEDGTLDRKVLADIVFADATRRSRLESIIHPRVREKMEADVAQLRAEGRTEVVICDIPLLFETGMSLDPFDRILVVYAPKEKQIRRLMERNGLTPEEAQLRLEAQWPTEEKVRRADDVIDNSGSIVDTLRQVDEVWSGWKKLTRRAHR